jgi:hypothetical protein
LDAHWQDLPPHPSPPLPPLDQLQSTSPQFELRTLIYSPDDFELCDWRFLHDLPPTRPECPPILLGVNEKGRNHIEFNVYPGRTGWLVGISEDRQTAEVLFRIGGFKYRIPFEYLTNGDRKRATDRVLFHSGPNRGRIGFVQPRRGKHKGKIALSKEKGKLQPIGVDLPEADFMRDSVKLLKDAYCEEVLDAEVA